MATAELKAAADQSKVVLREGANYMELVNDGADKFKIGMVSTTSSRFSVARATCTSGVTSPTGASAARARDHQIA